MAWGLTNGGWGLDGPISGGGPPTYRVLTPDDVGGLTPDADPDSNLTSATFASDVWTFNLDANNGGNDGAEEGAYWVVELSSGFLSAFPTDGSSLLVIRITPQADPTASSIPWVSAGLMYTDNTTPTNIINGFIGGMRWNTTSDWAGVCMTPTTTSAHAGVFDATVMKAIQQFGTLSSSGVGLTTVFTDGSTWRAGAADTQTGPSASQSYRFILAAGTALTVAQTTSIQVKIEWAIVPWE